MFWLCPYRKMTMEKAPKILFYVTEDWYFCSHRLPLALAAKNAGFSVTVVTQVKNHGELISSHGLKLVPLPLSRHNLNPFRELFLISRLIKILKRESPDILHNVSLKPVISGSLAARYSRIPRVINTLTGLGFIFSSRNWKARLSRPVIEFIFRRLLNQPSTRFIFQNPDDREYFVHRKLIEEDKTVLVRGSGVDMNQFSPTPEAKGPPVVLLASRMLWKKGVDVFVEAARQLVDEGVSARFVLAGGCDSGSPIAVPQAVIEKWNREGVIEWWRHRADMAEVFHTSHIVCLPTTYGEGVPKVLIEAAACGRAIITTDVPGCREIVIDRQNGILIPPGNVKALADAIRTLIEDPQLRQKMGESGRRLASSEFSSEQVIAQTLALYK
jgi:glycosyltransferase involved in cell wall biosynthesis